MKMEMGKPPSQFYARSAGFALVFTIIQGFLNSFIIKSGIYNVDTFASTESQYRFAHAIDLLMFVLVIWMSWAFYLTTKLVSKSAAMLGMLFRFGEALIGCVVVLFSLMVAAILGKGKDWASFETEQLHELSYMFMTLSDYSWGVLYILMGIGAAVFMILFYRARLVPRWLSLWGIVTYVMMIGYGVAMLLLPEQAGEFIYAMFPGALFELLLGILLLIKGVNYSAIRVQAAKEC